MDTAQIMIYTCENVYPNSKAKLLRHGVHMLTSAARIRSAGAKCSMIFNFAMAHGYIC